MHICTCGLQKLTRGYRKSETGAIPRENLVSLFLTATLSRTFTATYTLAYTTGPVCTYLLDRYLQDVEGYNISHSVHVEAGWPGDPVAETLYVYVYT